MAREQEAYKERRMKEREEMTKRRASQKVSSRMVSESEGRFDLKRELEARKSRTIDIVALERGRERKSAASGQLSDLRHHLRKTEPPPRWEEGPVSGQQWLEDLPPPLHDDQLLEYDSETYF